MQCAFGTGAIKKDFVEFRTTGDLANGTHFHTGLFDGHQQQAQARVARAAFLGTGQHKNPFGLMRPGCPDFLAINHPLARGLVAARLGANGGQVRTRAGLGVTLSPIVRTRQNAGQKALLLLRRAIGHQRWRQQRLANMANAARAATAHIFLVEDDLLGQRRIAPAILHFPAKARPAALGQLLLPLLGQLRVIAFRAQPCSMLERGELASQMLRHPFTHFGAKGFIDF